jgi:hypothetical protein
MGVVAPNGSVIRDLRVVFLWGRDARSGDGRLHCLFGNARRER